MDVTLFFLREPHRHSALTGPELGVAISQAHVSTISICIYLNDATNLHQSGSLFIIEQKRGRKLVSKEKGGGLIIPKRLVS